MEEIALNKTKLVGGVWEGLLTGAGEVEPDLIVTHLGEPLDALKTERSGEGWRVCVTIPAERLADGVQTFLISDAGTGTELAHFAVMAGEALSDDIYAELNLLREELDMLKRAFRRHCLETM